MSEIVFTAARYGFLLLLWVFVFTVVGVIRRDLGVRPSRLVATPRGVSFTGGRFVSFPPEGVSLQWYDQYFGSSAWMEATIRSFVVATFTGALSMLLGVKAFEEFVMHVRAALDGPPESRLTPEDIKEVIMMAAIYVGVPAANHAFGLASAVLKEKGLLTDPAA